MARDVNLLTLKMKVGVQEPVGSSVRGKETDYPLEPLEKKKKKMKPCQHFDLSL